MEEIKIGFKIMPVIYQGEDYILLIHYASGYCEIVKHGDRYLNIKLVHFSEFKLKEELPSISVKRNGSSVAARPFNSV